MIVGNVEEYIERCLKSFFPIADEICLVRAIGNQTPDKTIEKAEKLITGVNGENRDSSNADSPLPPLPPVKSFKWSEYKNDPDHADWPHLDDFAAARNQSFDLATGKYCFWADSDDILESGAEAIREDAKEGKWVVYIIPYKIFGRDVNIQRERMMRRGSGKWVYPVHECFAFDPQVEGALDERAAVLHLPDVYKTGSNDRNLRILEAIPKKDLTPGLKYHLHGELLGTKQIDRSIKVGMEAAVSPDLGIPERYEIFLNLGKVARDRKTSMDLFHEAYKLDPERREAFGLLACTAMDHGLTKEALAYARAMMALPPPEKANWNDRNSAYDWLGVDIYTQALRSKASSIKPHPAKAGSNLKLLGEAEKHRVAVLDMARKSGRPIISLIHATRGRAIQASKARKMWLDLADRPDAIEHIFVYDQDDEKSYALQRMHHQMIPAGLGSVGAWNAGAASSTGDILIQMSDDWVPPLQWDTKIIQRFSQKKTEKTEVPESPLSPLPPVNSAKVLAISDAHRKDDLLCMAIMTRAYYELDWFMFHPRFTGVYSDNWFTHEAYRRNAVIDAKDLIFTHDHPFFTGGNRENGDSLNNSEPSPLSPLPPVNLDETYQRQNDPARYAEGMAIYNELLAGNDWSTIPGWFNYWPLYQLMARILKDGDVVAEIGVWLGRSIIMLAQECKRLGKKVKFLAVDNFKGEENQPMHEATIRLCGGNIKPAFLANMERCGVGDMITILEGDSAKMARNVPVATLAFCFIDAAHDFESVRNDITAWLPKVKPGHCLAGHDAQWEDVKKAVLARFGDKALINGPVWMAKAEGNV
jgi:cephalosporin hydroxylase